MDAAKQVIAALFAYDETLDSAAAPTSAVRIEAMYAALAAAAIVKPEAPDIGESKS